MTTIYLVRHGESQSNVNKTFTGQKDSPLTELGQMQAACIASYFLGQHIDCIYASDLSRAYDTAKPLSMIKRVPIRTHTAFREIYGGKWEGEKFSELSEMYPEDYAVWREDIANARPTGGESIKEIAMRTCRAADEIVREHEGETIVIATHAIPVRVMLSTWLTGDLSGLQATAWVPNASISKVEYSDGRFAPVEIGITSHLDDMITNLPDKI